jgi:tRNA(Ile)-lysidine synthase
VGDFLTQLATSAAGWSSTAAYAVGVSGGADSVALLLGLRKLGFENLVVCHVDHGLRGAESAADAAFVAELASAAGLPFELESLDVSKLAAQAGKSTELMAREVRLAFFQRVCRLRELHGVFLAHHADDVAETLLLHLFRGTAGKGLQGMRPETLLPGPLRLLRPLLRIRRMTLQAWLQAHGQSWREDASNALPIATRNRLRLELLPLADAIFQRDVVPNLLRLADLQAEDEAYWDAELPAMWAEAALPVKLLRQLPQPQQSRVVQRWLHQTHAVPRLTAEHVRAVRGLTEQEYPATANLPSGRCVRRSQGWLNVGAQARE